MTAPEDKPEASPASPSQIITQVLGERCEAFEQSCMTCLAWAMLDEIDRLSKRCWALAVLQYGDPGKALYEETARAHGFVQATAWKNQPQALQQFYRNEAQRKQAHNTNHLESAVDMLRCIGSMGQKAGSASATNWLLAHGYPLEDGGYIPGQGFERERE